MDNSKFLKLVILILLLINIGTLSFLWINRPPRENGPRRGGEIGEFLMHELHFTPEQRKQFEQLRDEHRSSVKELRDNNERLRGKLYDSMGTVPTDSSYVHQLADSITQVQKQIEISTFYHFQKVRLICTPEQQQEFDQVIKEGLNIRPPHSPHR
jgi:Spy/CpxP family protein refolding chaperone